MARRVPKLLCTFRQRINDLLSCHVLLSMGLIQRAVLRVNGQK